MPSKYPPKLVAQYEQEAAEARDKVRALKLVLSTQVAAVGETDAMVGLALYIVNEMDAGRLGDGDLFSLLIAAIREMPEETA